MDPDQVAYVCTCQHCKETTIFVTSLVPWQLPWNSHTDDSDKLFRIADGSEKLALAKLTPLGGIYATNDP